MPLYGVDLSNYQAGIDLARVRGEGFDFAMCKVSQGDGYRSPDWPRQRDQGRQAGLLVAGYHYVDTDDPARQASNCAAHLGDRSIPVCLDLEEGGGDLGNYRRVLDAFRAAGMRVVLSYIPRWYWEKIGSPSLAGLPPLWSSRYPSSSKAPASTLYQAVEDAGGPTSKYWAGYGDLGVAVLQFASTATVAGQVIDADAYLGSRDQLAALFAGGAAPGGGGGSSPAGADSIPSMQEGDVGAHIHRLASWLNVTFPAYSDIPLDSNPAAQRYGPKTSAVILEFQRRSGITGSDGRNVGPQTKPALWSNGYRP